MTLLQPDYLIQLGIVDMDIDFEWQDTRESKFEQPRIYNKYSYLYARCELGLAISFTEWIYWSLSKVSLDPLFIQFIEASWASLIDRRYLNYKSRISYYCEEFYNLSENPFPFFEKYSKNDFLNIKQGPILVALDWLAEAIDRTTPNSAGTLQAVYLSNLVEQVLNKEMKLFRKWRRTIITDRLEDYYLIKEDDESFLGPPIPREAFDPSFDYTLEKADLLINQFLEKLDYTDNPFLASPEELIKLGFEGTPYSYGVD